MIYADRAGDKCDWYNGANSSWCGNYDTAYFKANEMCCGCGGGSQEPVEFVMGCVETTNGATDIAGDSCEWYAENSSYCGAYDTPEFSANDMCCECSGGEEIPTRIELAPVPTVPRGGWNPDLL